LTIPLRVVFAGTPDFAAKHLQALIDSKHEVVAVYSQPDRPAGRGKKLQASPVKQLAEQSNVAVLQPQNFKTEAAQQQLADLEADVMVVVAYGLILPQNILDTPKYGCLNVHGSLLPRWRGAAPIQRSIWAGDKQTGVTIMQMDSGLDTGAMLLKKSIPITSKDTSASLYTSLASLGPPALIETLDNLTSMTAEIQDDALANYAKKLSKQEAKIDWAEDAAQLERNIRAFNPWPMAFFECKTGSETVAIKVWRAEVQELSNQLLDPNAKVGQIISSNKEGILIKAGKRRLLLTIIQIPGKKAMPVADILNSRKEWFAVGSVLR